MSPTWKASSCPRKSHTPEMLLSLLVPKRMTLAKAFLRSLSRRWNIPAHSSAAPGHQGA